MDNPVIIVNEGNFFGTPLTYMVFLPVVGAIFMLLIPRVQESLVKWAALLISLVTAGIGIYVMATFDYSGASGPQMAVNLPWIPVINSRYHIGVDGISLPMIALTLLIVPLC